MVLGLASGVTNGEVLNFPVRRVDCLEISPQVVEASDFFRPWNGNCLDDPRHRMIIQDGRAHLEHTRQKYDVVISAPSNVWMAGLAALFTTDFYEEVKDRLSDDGIFVQFIYAYQIDWSSFAMMGRTFASVFPNSMLVSTDPSTYGVDYLLVGFKSEAARIDPNVARRNQQYVAKSRNVRLANTDLLFRMIVSENLASLFGPGAVNSDDHPQLEFSAPKMIYMDEGEIIQTIHMKKIVRPETAAIAQALVADPNAQVEYADYAMSIHDPFPGMVQVENLSQQQKERYFRIVADYASKNEIEDLTADDGTFPGELAHLCRQVQIDTIRRNIDRQQVGIRGLAYLGDLLHVENRIDEAIAAYKATLAKDPVRVEIHMNLGIAYYRNGDIETAKAQFEEAIRVKPDYAVAHLYLARLLAAQGNQLEANKHFTIAKELEGEQ
jgi:spermidine synthase